MHDPLPMRRGERLRRLQSDPYDRERVERPPVAEPLFQRAPRHVFHDEKRQAAVLAHLVDGRDVLVRHGRHRPGLAGEPLPGGGQASERRIEQFHGHMPVERPIKSLEHDARRTPAEHARDLVGADAADEGGVVAQRDERLDDRCGGAGRRLDVADGPHPAPSSATATRGSRAMRL